MNEESDKGYGLMFGKYPAWVREYDKTSRICRVEIPGLTDGGDVLKKAEILYPIGDKSRDGVNTTEIEITPDDAVWVEFIGGDQRYPLIVGYRNPQVGNSMDWRRWHHANVEMLSEMLMKLISGGDFLIKSGSHVTIQAPRVTIDAPETNCTGNMTIDGNLAVKGDSVTHGGVNIGKTHNHDKVVPGDGISGDPI
jgi:hypothetical protein